jgi:prophage regulatory protein
MDRIVREAECRRITGLARTTRWKLEKSGQFPTRRRLAGNSVGWLESELSGWLQSRAAGVTAPPAPMPDAQQRSIERHARQP